VRSLSYLRDDERRAALAALASPPGVKSNVELISAATIEPVPIKWLWHGWLAPGRMNVLAGPPGGGKTTLAGEMAAIVSTGGLWPDGSRAKQGNVVIWTGEDDPEDTLVPRLIASGADLCGVHFVGNTRDENASRSFDPAKDMAELSTAIERFGDIRLVIIDPIARRRRIPTATQRLVATSSRSPIYAERRERLCSAFITWRRERGGASPKSD
jgi:AAA domain